MNKLQPQSGFGTIEALLMLIIVLIIGFTGWYVVHTKTEIDDNLKTTEHVVAVSKTDSTPNIKQDQASNKNTNDFTDSRKIFSLAKPAGWTSKEYNHQNEEFGWNKQPLSQIEFRSSDEPLVEVYLFDANTIEEAYTPIFVNTKSIKFEDKMINGYAAKFTEWKSEDGEIEQDYWIIKNGKVAWLSFTKADGKGVVSRNLDAFKSMVDSVIFL